MNSDRIEHQSHSTFREDIVGSLEKILGKHEQEWNVPVGRFQKARESFRNALKD